MFLCVSETAQTYPNPCQKADDTNFMPLRIWVASHQTPTYAKAFPMGSVMLFPYSSQNICLERLYTNLNI